MNTLQRVRTFQSKLLQIRQGPNTAADYGVCYITCHSQPITLHIGLLDSILFISHCELSTLSSWASHGFKPCAVLARQGTDLMVPHLHNQCLMNHQTQSYLTTLVKSPLSHEPTPTPQNYSDLLEVFSKEWALPWDCSIDLLSNAMPHKGQIYPQSNH